MIRSSFARGPLWLYALASLPFVLFVGTIRCSSAQEYGPASVQRLISGEAVTPFQYRTLVPWTYRLFEQFVTIPPDGFRQMVIWGEIAMLYLAGLAICYYLLGLAIRPLLAVFGALFYYYLIPFLYIFVPLSRFYYPSDTMSVCIFAFGLACLVRGHGWAYAATLVIGAFNRETVLFLVLVFAVSQFRVLPLKRWALLVLLQLLALTAIRALLVHLYSNNPGAGMVSLDHDIMHRGWPKSPESSRLFTNIMLFLRWDSLVIMMGWLGMLWVPLLMYWRRLPSGFARQSLIVIPTLLLVMMLVGNLNEFRIYGELVPIVLGALAVLANQACSGWLADKQTRAPEVMAG